MSFCNEKAKKRSKTQNSKIVRDSTTKFKNSKKPNMVNKMSADAKMTNALSLMNFEAMSQVASTTRNAKDSATVAQAEVATQDASPLEARQSASKTFHKLVAKAFHQDKPERTADLTFAKEIDESGDFQ